VYQAFTICVFSGYTDGVIYSYNAATGARLKSFPAQTNSDSPLIAFGKIYGTVFPQSGAPYVAAWDVTTGQATWTNTDICPPLLANANILFTGCGAVDPTSGQPLWLENDEIPLSADVYTGAVYMSDGSGNVVALDGATGTQLWYAPVGGIGAGTLYGNNGGVFWKTDARTGRSISMTHPYGCNFTPNSVANGVVFGGTKNCGTVAVNAATGQLLGKLSTASNTAPVVAGSSVYLLVGKVLYSYKP
jgi:outer membrane protein assembly factor BamB